jgi:4-hydroxybenzoate polyprenyltransferase/phosphoserine phosphatase
MLNSQDKSERHSSIFPPRPLCVDLDGTIIATDTLAESLALIIKTSPILLLALPYWLIRGKYFIKSQIEKHTPLDAADLPYREKVLDFIREEKSKGRTIVLATATMPQIANKVSEYLGLFDLVLTSKNGQNLRAANKRDKLIQLFGEKGFDYAGDSKADIKVWAAADKAILVQPSKRVLKKARLIGNVDLVFKKDFSKFSAFIDTIRIKNWLKNIIIFIPMFFSVSALLSVSIWKLLTVLGIFCLLTTANNIFNDIIDINSDRRHRLKRKRPITSGNISLFKAFKLLILTATAPIVVSTIYLSPLFTLYLILFLITSAFYSLFARRNLYNSALVLTATDLIRVLSGVYLFNVNIPAFVFLGLCLLFFSLSALKLYSEFAYQVSTRDDIPTNTLVREQNSTLKTFGIASAYLSLAIYYTSIERLYSSTDVFHAIASAAFVLWINRLWSKASQGKLHGEPLVYSFKEFTFYILIILMILCSF